MEPLHILFLVLVGMGAGFVQRVSGFGLGIFVMLFLPHFMPELSEAAAISSLFCIGTASYNAIRYRRDISFKTTLPMFAAAMVSITVAVYFSARVSAEIFKALLGSALILLSIYFLVFSSKIKIKPTAVNGIIAGTLGGTLGGLFSTGGPPAVLYLTNATPDKTVYFASIQFYFCLTNIYATTVRAVNGIITAEVLVLSAIGLVGCMTGDFLGRLVFDRLDSDKIKRIIYIGMIVSGVLMVI